ncbi:MAG TPA: ADOP family duplicated permease [Candidatus Baltobacteraceae bacterium]
MIRAPWFVECALGLCPREFRIEYREQIRADCRARGSPLGAAADVAANGLMLRWESLVRDVAYGLRSLRRAPLFTAIALLTLALAISVNAAVFGVISTVLLKPLPFAQADNLVFLCRPDGCDTQYKNWDIRAYQDGSRTLEGIGAFQFAGATLTGFGTPQNVDLAYASTNFFDVLRAHPMAGRFFIASDARKGVRDLVISQKASQRFFGGARSAIGKTLTLDGAQWRVVGVASANFVSPVSFGAPGEHAFDAWEPLPEDSFVRGFDPLNDFAFARVRPGVAPAALAADLNRITAGVVRQNPISEKGLTARAVPFRQWYFHGLRAMLFLALLAVFAVLLIACANVANLLLVRGVTRTGEFAVRNALGASRSRIANQLLTEVVLLAAGGGILGLGLAWVELSALAALHPQLPNVESAGIDGRVAFFTLVVVVITTLVAGVVPAFFTARRNVNATLRSTGRSGDASGGKSFRAGLAIAEIALAFAVVFTSGLLVRSSIAMAKVDFGFDPRGMYLTEMALGSQRYRRADARAAFAAGVLARVEALPGVDSATIGRPFPFSGDGIEGSGFRFPGRAYTPGTEPHDPYRQVSPSFFHVYGLRLENGRIFTANDRAGAARVVMVGRSFAKMFFGGGNPVGRQILIQPGTATWTPATIVGEVRDTLGNYAGDLPPIYLPNAQMPTVSPELAIRMRANDPHLRERVAAAVAAIDPNQAMGSLRSIENLMEQWTAPARTGAMLLGVLALVALILAIAGIYAIVAYSVEQRRHEFGIRMAIGARRTGVVRAVLGGALRLGVLGIALGIVVAASSTQMLAGMLFRVSTLDPITFVAVIIVLLASIALACAIPALRATRVDPARALRYE